jgi:hypothetical protein
MVQGINKKFTRRVHRKKQSSATYDAQFDGLYQQFVTKQEMVRQFERGVQHWLVQIKESDQSLSNLIDSLELVYGDSDGIGLRSIRAFKMLVSQLLAYPIVSSRDKFFFFFDMSDPLILIGSFSAGCCV